VDHVAASVVGVDVAKDFILSFSSFFSTFQKKISKTGFVVSANTKTSFQ
jgi:hypothetical protein